MCTRERKSLTGNAIRAKTNHNRYDTTCCIRGHHLNPSVPDHYFQVRLFSFRPRSSPDFLLPSLFLPSM